MATPVAPAAGAVVSLDHGADAVVYLDHAATTPMRPEVRAAMEPYLAHAGNPSGSHQVAREAKKALEEAREEVAAFVGADPLEVVFTSGGTEADNLAIVGPLLARPPGGTATVACSAVEHPAVLETCRAVAGDGSGPEAAPGAAALRHTALRHTTLHHTTLPVDGDGRVQVARVPDLLGPDTAVVSVMAANNETGVVQPLEALARALRVACPDAVVHTDAVQAAPWLELPPLVRHAHLVTISGHKLGGPRGSGALVVRADVALRPVLHGGGQERGLRSGTVDVAAAVGLAAATRAVSAKRAEEAARVGRLRDALADGIMTTVPGATPCAPRQATLPGHLLVRFPGVEREELLVLLDGAGICASGGSSCASGALEPSHVLLAMGLSPAEAAGAVRFTLGRTTTGKDVERTLAALPALVDRLRA